MPRSYEQKKAATPRKSEEKVSQMQWHVWRKENEVYRGDLILWERWGYSSVFSGVIRTSNYERKHMSFSIGLLLFSAWKWFVPGTRTIGWR